MVMNANFLEFTDPRDGYNYKAVIIGVQLWQAENLRYAHSSSKIYYNNPDIGEVYGRIYDVMHFSEICPPGWTVPTQSEWQELIDYCGGPIFAGNELKEAGNEHWSRYNKDTTNSSGFTALLGGAYIGFDVFTDLRESGYFWSSTLERQDSFFNYYFGVAMDGIGSEADISSGVLDNNFIIVRCIKSSAK